VKKVSTSGVPSGIAMKRDSEAGSFFFFEIFQGFGELEAVTSIFQDDTEKVLKSLKVDLQSRRGYARVDDETGNIVVSLDYLKQGDERHIYLDVIHELVHIRQFMEGKELFDMKYGYLERPTEIEAYAAAVEEAKKIGMKEDEIVEYLRVEWVTEDEFQLFLQTMGFVPAAEEPDC
jgi:hypothetical protein